MPLSRRLGALAGVAAADLAWLALQPVLVGATRWIPPVVALGAHTALVAVERRRPALPARAVVVAVAIVAVGATLLAPYGSRDLYQYAAYGRLAAHHGTNPHLAGPDAAPLDPIAAEVADGWRDTPSVYGPLFTGVAAVGALGFGGSPLLARLWFQALAAAALVGSVALLRRRGRPPWVLASVGLSPALAAVVNGGHNDLLVGVLGLAAVDLVRRDRIRWGAAALAAACLVKLLAVPIVAGVVVRLVASRRWRAAAEVVAAVGGSLVAGYALVGGTAALAPLRSVGDHRSRATAWALLEQVAPGGGPWPVGALAAAAGLVGAAVLVHRALRRSPSADPTAAELAVGLGVVACALAAYVLPWYPAAFLPLAALVARRRAAIALHVVAAALLLAYVQPPGRPASELVGAGPAASACGLVLLLAAATTVVAGRRP